MTNHEVPRVATIVATRRMTAEEVERASIAIHPDLVAVEASEELELSIGGVATFVHGDPGCWLEGPTGWLGELAAGDLVVLRLVDERRLTIERADVDALDVEASRRLAVAIREAIERGDEDLEEEEEEEEEAGFEDLEELVDELLGEHPELFATAGLPLGEALADEGLVVHGDWVGLSSVDWDRVDAETALSDDEEDIEHLLHTVAARYGLSSEQGLAAMVVAVHADPPDDGVAPLTDAQLIDMLDSGDTMPAAVFDVAVAMGVDASQLRSLAERLQSAARGPARAATSWLTAAAAELDNDPVGQERHLKAAIAADGEYPLALLDASWFASDRGDAAAASSYLRRAGHPDDGWARRLAGYAKPGPLAAARNEPCTCGSGRKYKSCCSAVNGWPVGERVVWLFDKAVAYLHRPLNEAAVLGLAAMWRAGTGRGFGEDDLGVDDDVRDDPVLVDLALFEGGTFGHFLADRERLLPADEAAVARTWLGSRRSVYEVVEARPGEGLTLSDVRTGLVVEVTERSASSTLVAPDLVFVRVLPDAAGRPQLWGAAVRIPPGWEDGLLQILEDDSLADGHRALRLAAWLGGLAPTPRVAPG